MKVDLARILFMVSLPNHKEGEFSPGCPLGTKRRGLKKCLSCQNNKIIGAKHGKIISIDKGYTIKA
jgi:hypothetical protein